MKVTYLVQLFSFLLVCLMACGEEMPDNTDNDPDMTAALNIHFGSFGGFCGFSDSMSVRVNLDITYDHKDLCTDTEYSKSSTLTTSEYNELFDLFSLSTFKSMDNNSCARCVDGQDTFLHIEGDDFSHRIIYDQDNEVADISDLVSRLNEMRDGLKQE